MQERGSWIRALYEQWIWWANSIKEDGISSSLISVCRGRKRRKEVKQLKERHSCLPVRLNYFLLIYLKISQRFSLETEQPFITSSCLFTSQVLLIIGRSTAVVLPFLSPFLAGSTSASLPIQAPLSSLSFTSPLYLICSLTWCVSGFKTMLHKIYFYAGAAATDAAKMHATNVNSATGHWSTHRM